MAFLRGDNTIRVVKNWVTSGILHMVLLFILTLVLDMMAKVAMIWDGGSDFGRVVVGIRVELLNLKVMLETIQKAKQKKKWL